MKIEPVAFSVTCNGCHVGNISSTQDQAIAQMTSLNADFHNDARSVEGLYTESQLRQLVEACAAICESEYDNWDNERPLRLCANAIRLMIKELLPAAELAKQ